jgi:hypothetical protein
VPGIEAHDHHDPAGQDQQVIANGMKLEEINKHTLLFSATKSNAWIISCWNRQSTTVMANNLIPQSTS